MAYDILFNLTTNPFRMTPANSADEIFWAGFPDTKAKFETRIKRSIKIPNSTLILNWGEYGSGKTHAGRYFGKNAVLASLANDSMLPYYIFISLPKGKSPIDDFYTSIIDKIDLPKIREDFANVLHELNLYIDSIADNVHIKAVLKAVFGTNIEVNLMKRYLYQSTNSSDSRTLADAGILRTLSSDTDFSKVVSGIFSCLTFEKRIYSSIILWIDEFEDIAIMTKVNGDKTNSFLREILDNTPNNLLMFLNLTQSALFNIEDLGEYISEAIKSRIKQRINFELPDEVNILLYIKELLGYYKQNDQEHIDEPYFPFDENVLSQLIVDLDNASLRKVNETLGLLLDLAEIDGITPVSLEYYEANKEEVIGDWKG
ncbi:MAG: hypothetical protein EOO91_01400 [Pedobacter sp.]|nr:MAG: hypothetical protein EOO91_01400 [Pedobacter sp.]